MPLQIKNTRKMSDYVDRSLANFRNIYGRTGHNRVALQIDIQKK